MATDTPTTTMLATDRCDRCGAQARYRAMMDHGDLLFCAHHERQFRERLDAEALYVQIGTFGE